MSVHEVDTPHGTAQLHVTDVAAPRGLLVLGHGAGGGVEAPDLVAVCAAAAERGVLAVRVLQPYRVAGRRAPAPARQLDASFIAAVAAARELAPPGVPLVVGGRSSGARVACRTAGELGAAGVLCLAFPLQPGPRKSGPAPSRLPELEAVAAPVLIVQGERDSFGMPPTAPGREVVQVAGDHALKRDVPAVVSAFTAWLDALLV